LGIGDWGLGIGDWGLGPIPNPQSPIPNPQSPFPKCSQKQIELNIKKKFTLKINFLIFFLIIKYFYKLLSPN
jgi:hypothetical protein